MASSIFGHHETDSRGYPVDDDKLQMDRKGVKFAKGGGKNGGQETPPSRSKSNLNGLPAIVLAKPNNNSTNNGNNGGGQKSKTDTPPSRGNNSLLPVIAGSERVPAAPPSSKSSRKMSATDGPQTAEFAYSRAVEQALRKFGFWSSKPLPRGYKTKYLEAEIPSLNDIYKDYVFMRKTRGESTSGPPQSFEEFRAVPTMSRAHVEPPPPEPSITVRTPVGRDTPMPKRLRSGAVSRFPSLAVEIRMKKPPRTPRKQTDAASSRSVSVVSVTLME